MTPPIPAAPVAADAGRAMASEPRYTTRDDTDLYVSLGAEPSGWIDIFDRGQRLGSIYMGTYEQNKAWAAEIVAILNAHDAAAINGVLAQHKPAEEAT